MINAIFNNVWVISRGGQFYWFGNPESLEKTMDLSQVTENLII